MDILSSIKKKELNTLIFVANWCAECCKHNDIFKNICKNYKNCKIIDVNKNEILTNYFKVKLVPYIVFIKNDGDIISMYDNFSYEKIEDTLKNMNPSFENNIIAKT